ncbi:MAG TPA: hypothetical protein VLX92_12470 [Kofleriaceae bacterium]|nr:hypothetical protein [Kofleriaceae bacterium]
MIRPAAALLLALLAGCPAEGNLADKYGSGSGSGSDGIRPECMVDQDCVAMGAKCCDCPSYAVPADDPTYVACQGVACPMNQCPDDVQPTCSVDQQCVLTCIQITCEATCADGFALDGNGCLSCNCAEVATRSCEVDTDCARTRADCCGCARGGSDTAVPVDDVAAYDASLMCPPSPACPSVDSCEPGLEPRCIQGACELTLPTPPQACGRTDLPACPSGQSCVLNVDETATMQGVGVCM